MSRNRLIAIIIGALGLIAALVPTVNAAYAERGRGRVEVLEFDVAEDMGRFVFDTDVAFEDGLPKHGSSFITQGYIYPAGTISCEEGRCNGVITTRDASGAIVKVEPEFPDKVLGEWTCRGYFVGEGAHAKAGPMVITTQLYNFGQELGNRTLVLEGYELADVGVAIERAITGGTGEYRDARGEAEQTMLGLNSSDGVSLRLKLEVRTN
ncbi:MAG TPA: hypothetical protein VNL77_24070 [Roseiflexaceae bacterium]|nr:hypothetical protein [Roseiflexaceae bacterium]